MESQNDLFKSCGTPLEQRVHSFSKLSLDDSQNIRLIRTIDDEMGRYTVDIVMPWRTVYNLGRYRTRVMAQVKFEEFDDKLKNGNYVIELTGPATAQVVEGTNNK